MDFPERPRISPLPVGAEDGEATELLTGFPAAGEPTSNIFRTLVRHPGLFRKWLPFGGKLLAGKLPARDRELAILRTAWNCRAPYEWAQHVPIALRSGVTDEDISRVRGGPDEPGWTPLEAALLRAADELHQRATISDATWSALGKGYDERQLIEIPMLIGHYHLVAFTLNALAVQPEPGLPAMPA